MLSYSELYEDAMDELKELIPYHDADKILSQVECEYDDSFWGFVAQYKNLSQLIPLDWIIIDFGCYLAPQSYFFKEHKQYIGVDTVKLKRFKPKNAKHYKMTIQEFIKTVVPIIVMQTPKSRIFAICSYVPDDEAKKLVRETFPNVFCYYPS